MDWNFILSASISSAIGARGRRVLPRSDRHQHPVRLHRPAELRSGRLPRRRCLRPGRHRGRSPGCSFWLGILVGLIAAILLALLLGVPTLASAGRLPRHRDHRCSRDRPAHLPVGHPSGLLRRFRRTAALRRTLLRSSTRSRRTRRTASAVVTFNERLTWLLLVGWTIVAIFLVMTWLLMRSPWGRVMKGDPRGRGRRPVTGQERVLVQDAVPDARRPSSVPSRASSTRWAEPRCSPTCSAPTSRSSPTPS